LVDEPSGVHGPDPANHSPCSEDLNHADQDALSVSFGGDAGKDGTPAREEDVKD